ncbi:glycoside hydrolase family 15 protein [Actinospica robiniae]|uniref:glycoside hydrolase family 15 protein n=1 Tax=Actinospica robiniae TaxID=304901 RepID=UPI0004004304|nr:glycoside hydrolase family 15 protein [Actinospica robiniae]
MSRYPLIADHGMVGDLQTAALVSSGGVVDWFAAPRFDSPSVFASLLDHDRGGHFTLAPAHRDVMAQQLYYPDSAVLITRFMSPEGVCEVIDWMTPITDPTPTDRHTLYRGIRVMRGSVTLRMACRPRFDYARADHELQVDGDNAVFRSPGATAYLQSRNIPISQDGRDVVGEVVLHAGDIAGVAFTVCDPDGAAPKPRTVQDILGDAWSTIDFWQRWVRASTYRGRWSGAVNRSAITIKLLTYHPSGAPVAAATMGLPEQIGGERNWDYRYTWVRDASLSVRALLDLGFVEEAEKFVHWLSARLHEREGKTGEPLQIMYRVDGDPTLTEETLDHLEGYRGSAPVRIGNGAADQLQLDIYGEALYALSEGREVHRSTGYAGWKALSRMLDWLADNWDRPDEGVWETRGGRKDFTFSRVMCWVAFDCGIDLATDWSRPADLAKWSRARDAILDQIMTKGWNEQEQALVQHYGDDAVLDASLLVIPRMCLLAPRDPAWLSTLEAMDRTLVSDSLVYRYDPAASPDGLRGSEGTFSLCSFLYVDALTRAGRLREARYAFEKMLTYSNHVGLFAEEIGPTGEQLGNFPQAFTHLALIMSATALDRALNEAREA